MFKRALVIPKRKIAVVPGKQHFFYGNNGLSGSHKGFTLDTNNDSFSDIGFPTSISGVAMGGVFYFGVSPDGKWMALALNGSGRLLLYRRTNDVWAQVSFGNTFTIPTSTSISTFFGISWTADSSMFVASCAGVNYVFAFQLSPDGTTFNYISQSGNGSSNTTTGVSLSPDGTYLAWPNILNSTSFTMWKWNGGGYSQLATLSLGVSQVTAIYGASWSPDGQFLFIGTNNLNASLIVYRRDGDSFTRIVSVGTPSNNARRLVSTLDCTYHCLGMGTGAGFYLYKWDPVALTMTKISGTPSAPGACSYAMFSPDGNYLAVSWVGAVDTVKVAVFHRVGDTLIDVGFPMPPDNRTNAWTLGWGAVPAS
jgi:hypothetical protein